MIFRLHYHPLSSYCWKTLIALYEAGTPFEAVLVNLGDPAARGAFLKISPFGKFPVLEDVERGQRLIETSTIIDYLAQYGGADALIPQDRDLARAVRAADRIFDLYVHEPMGRIIADLLRPEARRDPMGVDEARARLDQAYDWLETTIGEAWAAGDFSLADCAAAPALFYAHVAHPIGDHPRLKAYLDRLIARPSFARVIEEARPVFQYYPLKARLPRTYPALFPEEIQ